MGKHVLVRADLNVPLEDGRVADDTRIEASLPTLRLLLERDAARVSVCSHLGRPKGPDPAYDMAPVAERLRELLPDDRIEVLENTRFDPGETKNDPESARRLAEGKDLFVNDAFGSSHRAHASTVGVAQAPARLRRPSAREGARDAGASAGRGRPAVRARRRRREGRGQARRAREPRRPRGHGPDRREDGGGAARREPSPVRGGPADGRRRGGGVRGGRRDPRRRVQCAPGGLARARYRPGDARALRGRAPPREDRVLERPDGRLRVAPVRRGHEGGRAGGRRGRRLHSRRRRRLGAGDRRSSASPTASRGSRPAAAPSLELLEGKELPGVAAIPCS